MKIHQLRRLSLGLAVLLLAGFGMTACGSSNAPDTAETAPPWQGSLPDLTDDRTFTSTAEYAGRLTAAFSQIETAQPADFTCADTDGGVSITAYLGTDSVLVIPDTIDGKPVVAIEQDAFDGKEDLRALSIPDSVTNIAAGALSDCQALTTLRTPIAAAAGSIHVGSLFGAETYETNASRVPSSLATLILTAGDTVPPYAFYDCNFEAVFLPESTSVIGDFAFYGNEKLVYIPLADTALTAVGDWAFTNCRSLLSLVLPATVDRMGFAMLEGCCKVESLTVPFVGASRTPMEEETEAGDVVLTADHFAYIFGARAYVHAQSYVPASLICVTLQAGCGDIPANAFFECASIREVVIPDGVTAVGRRAFYSCEKLSALSLPDSVREIGDDALHGCIRLVQVDLGEGLTTLGVQAFMDCFSLESVTLPAGVTALPNGAFSGCVSLVGLTAPGVTEVGTQTFRHCEKLVGWDEAADTQT